MVPGVALYLVAATAPWETVRLVGLASCFVWTVLVLLAGFNGVALAETPRARRTGAGVLASVVVLVFVDVLALVSFAA